LRGVGSALPTSTPAACVVDGILYVMGGHYPYTTPVRQVFAFYPQGGVTPRIWSVTLEGTNRLNLIWQAEAGIAYGVESSPNLAANRWTPVTLPTGSTVTATGDLAATRFPVTPAEPRQFYRVFEAN